MVGHEVPSYQGEASYRIFQRALSNLDIATGTINTAENRSYATDGTPDTWHIKNDLPSPFLDFCYLYNVGALCTEEQVSAVQNGSAEIRSWIIVDKNSSLLFPDVVNAVESDIVKTPAIHITMTSTERFPAATRTSTALEEAEETDGDEADYQISFGPPVQIVLD